jgi:hypothetical protein
MGKCGARHAPIAAARRAREDTEIERAAGELGANGATIVPVRADLATYDGVETSLPS